MNVQLHHAVTDITGVTGMRIIRAIVSGVQEPQALAEPRCSLCRVADETLFALRQALDSMTFTRRRWRSATSSLNLLPEPHEFRTHLN
jgi:hypothetical protein